MVVSTGHLIMSSSSDRYRMSHRKSASVNTEEITLLYQYLSNIYSYHFEYIYRNLDCVL